MASRLIDQPTSGGTAPRMSQGPATPITSAGSGLNAMAAPTLSARGTSSPFSTAGPLLGGLVGAILANRSSANAMSAQQAAAAKTTSAQPAAAGGSGGALTSAIKGGLNSSTGAIGSLLNPAIPTVGNNYDAQGNVIIPTSSNPAVVPQGSAPPTTPNDTYLAGNGSGAASPALVNAINQAFPSNVGVDPAAQVDPLTGTSPAGDALVQAAMPDYSSGTYQDNSGNIWSNGSLVYDASTGDYFSGGQWMNSTGSPYSFDSGTPYDFGTTPIPVDSGYTAPIDTSTSFGAPSYDFSAPAYDFSTPTPSYDYSIPYDPSTSFDTGSYNFGFKDGGNVTMMKKGGLPSFAAGGGIDSYGNLIDTTGQILSPDISYPTVSGGWVDAAGNSVDASGNPIDVSTSAFDLPTNMFADLFPATPAANTSAATSAAPAITPSLLSTLSNYLPTGVMNYLNSASNNVGGTLFGAAAGAGLGSLLSGMTTGVGGVNQGIDMSQVGNIAPHTTDFGMGPAKYVGYDQYGTQGGPDVYANSDLYKNLGTPQNAPPTGGLASIQGKADGGSVHFTYGRPIDPTQIMQGDQGMQGMRDGGTPEALGHPEVAGRRDFRQGSYVDGPGDGQSDDIPAMLADGEYVFDADTVAALGNGSSKAGSAALDKMREDIRAHKRSAPINKIPPPAKSPLAYLKGMKK